MTRVTTTVRTVAMLVLFACAACRSADDAPRPLSGRSAPSSPGAPAAPSTATATATAAITAIAELRTRLGAGAPPPLGQPGYVEPLTEAHHEWVNDRAVPMNDRIGRAATLYEDTAVIMMKYVAADQMAVTSIKGVCDGTATLRWSG